MTDRKTDPRAFASEYLARCKANYYVPKMPRPVRPKTFQAITCPDDLPAEVVAGVVKLNNDWKAAWLQRMRQYDAEWAVWSDQAKALEAEQSVDRIAWLRWVHEFRDEDFRQPLFHAIQRESVAMEVAGFATTDHTLDYLVRAFYTGWVRARLKPVLAVDKSPYDG